MTYILELPWGEESKRYERKYKGYLSYIGQGRHLLKGITLPQELKEYRVADFSYNKWYEDELRIKKGEQPEPYPKPRTVFTPREHQKTGAQKIFTSFKKGDSGFLLADSTGLGKTLTALVGVTASAKQAGYTIDNKANLLIVAPKGVLPVWRQTLQSYPLALKYTKPLVINYQQLNKLLEEPSPASKSKKKSAKKTVNRRIAKSGKSKINWNFIIFDESQYLKNYGSSTVSLTAANLAQLNTPYKKDTTPFTLFCTATPGSTPIHFSIMANWIAPLINKTLGEKVTPNQWGEFLQKQGFAVKKTKTGWVWAQTPWYGKNSRDPREKLKYKQEEKKTLLAQKKDTVRIGKALKTPGAPFIKRSPVDIANWPEQQLITLPVKLEPEQRKIYEEAWLRFRQWLKMNPKGKDPKGALVENLRYRQKSSLLKVPVVSEYAKGFVEQGKQVYISVEFIETVDKYKEAFTKAGIPVSEISGRTAKEREQERLKFQRGETKIVISTVVEGISLHAKETLPDGSQATSNERVTFLADLRENNISNEQALGRCHRSGENSIAYFPYLEDTIDNKVMQSFVNKSISMMDMTGSSEQAVKDFEDVYRNAL